MVLRRVLGLGSASDGDRGAGPDARPAAAETATVRRIVAELEALPPAERRFLAGFAYVLSRAAHADLDITADETRLMERVVTEIGGLPEPQAVLVVEIAKSQAQLYSGTEDYLVTREFAAHASDQQKMRLVECAFAVVAADHSITAEENAELSQIATELGLTRDQLNIVRREYRDHMAAIQRMRSGGRR